MRSRSWDTNVLCKYHRSVTSYVRTIIIVMIFSVKQGLLWERIQTEILFLHQWKMLGFSSQLGVIVFESQKL